MEIMEGVYVCFGAKNSTHHFLILRSVQHSMSSNERITNGSVIEMTIMIAPIQVGGLTVARGEATICPVDRFTQLERGRSRTRTVSTTSPSASSDCQGLKC